MVDWRPEEVELEDFYQVRVTTNRALDSAQAWQLFGCIGYAFRIHFRGEPLGLPHREGVNGWSASYDITKSASDDWSFHFADALADARRFAVEGTPPRKRPVAGAPAGSRTVEGLGPIVLAFEFA